MKVLFINNLGGGYADYLVNHERQPGVGTLSGWRGAAGSSPYLGTLIERQGNWLTEAAAQAPEDAAVVIGIEDYFSLPDVPNARRDGGVVLPHLPALPLVL